MKAFRIVNLFAAIIMVFAMLPQQQVVLAQSSAADISRSTKYVPGEVLVDFGSNVSAADASSKAAALSGQIGASVTRQSGSLALLSFSPDANVPALASQIQASGQVYSAQPNYIYWSPEATAKLLGKPVQTSGFSTKSSSGKTTAITWDQVMAMRTVRKTGSKSLANPTFPNEVPTAWGWNQIGAELIWPNLASASVMVCELDTGVDGNQADLKTMVVNGPDEVNADTIPNDDNGHGTAVAGVIAGKLNNGVGTAAGVYNGKIEAVKVLNSQGYGTSYSVAAGVKFCAGLATVKVINMSLETDASADHIVYNNIKSAVKTTSNLPTTKLIVAAAGNDSSSNYVFPAAWALQNVDSDGVYHATASDSTNTIYSNLIAVAGGAAPNSTDKIWVDGDLNGTQGTADSTELFKTEQCASASSNYGDWISLVAPGENILTTTPTSYPFNLQLAGVPSGYAYFSGTSMAAAFASGAAARVWSLTPTVTGDTIKSKLVSTGTPLMDSINSTYNYFMVEAYAYNGFDPTLGYNNPATGVGSYGDINDENSTIYAPYCWPGWTGTPNQPKWVINTAGVDPQLSNMENPSITQATYLNVAAAMNRTGLYAQALDAVTGQPLAGASITASLQSGTSTFTYTLKDTSVVPSNGANVLLINLPINPGGAVTKYQLSISKTGYTAVAQPFDLVTLDPGNGFMPGVAITDAYSKVSVPPNTNLNLVLDWNEPANTHPNLDLYLWLPGQQLPGQGNTTLGGVIGHNALSGNTNGPADLNAELDSLGLKLATSAPATPFLGAGTLLAPTAWGGLSTDFSPYAVHNFNGEIQVDTSDNNPAAAYYPAMESISVLGDPASKPTAKAPMLKPFFDKISLETYTVMVADNNAGGFLTNDPGDPNFIAPMLRVWAKGYLVTYPTAFPNPTDPNYYGTKLQNGGCDGSNSWWHAIDIVASTPKVNAINTCGGGNSSSNGDPSFFPYSSVINEP